MIKKVFIIGMMGVGKTSVGFNLSNECGVKFIDTDDCLDINSLINNSSNNKFRHQEYEEILRCSKLNQKLIISTGGGSVSNQACSYHNPAAAHRRGCGRQPCPVPNTQHSR